MKKFFITLFCILNISSLIFLCYLGWEINNKLSNISAIETSINSINEKTKKIEDVLGSIRGTVNQIRGKLGIKSWEYYP